MSFPWPGDRLTRLEQALALHPRPALARVGRRRLEQVGVGAELADQREAGAVVVAEAGDLMRAVARIADEHEGTAGETDQEQAQEPAHELGGRAVRPLAESVVLLGAVQVHQHWQGPGAGGEGKLDQYGEHDPLVPVAPGGVRLGGPDRVAMAGLAVDALALVAVHRVVAD